MGRVSAALLLICFSIALSAQTNSVSKVWVADNGDGTYSNPILHADYSDPDVIRVGEDYYMTASSFNSVPGLPILQSKDLVNWRIINHAIRYLDPGDIFSKPQHGGGVWAPSIRYHDGEFYIYYGDPDFGIFMTKAKDPVGIWSKPTLVKAAKGWIDPCPLWDDDGNAYLVHAFAGSRAGIKSILVVNRMDREGTRVIDDGVIVFDGHDEDPTVEGPKLYKFGDWYYILAPAGGVPTGWQLALRSKSIYGPYERRVVLAQGNTAVNGPHQGGLVDTSAGEWWFVHFQDKGAYGRVVHLEPATWKNGFPVIGADPDGDGTGEPVLKFRKPNVGRNYAIETPADSDEFNGPFIGPQWQWHADPRAGWAFLFPDRGVLRFYSVELSDDHKNLWDVPNLLLQKFPAETFIATAKIRLATRVDGERFGLVVFGMDYSMIAVTARSGDLSISQVTAVDAENKGVEKLSSSTPLRSKELYLRVEVSPGAICRFSYSVEGRSFNPIGTEFTAREGKWIGAKVGFVFTRPRKFNDAGSADIDWIRFEK